MQLPQLDEQNKDIVGEFKGAQLNSDLVHKD